VDHPKRPDADALLAELGYSPRCTIFLASVPGAGKTHRLLTEAAAAARAGRRVAIGWIELKNRPHLDMLMEGIPRIPARRYLVDGRMIEDFDYEAALASIYEIIVLDELAHTNPPGAVHSKRWQDALALRAAGKSVLGALNVFHVDSIAPAAERIIGYPVREVVPLSLLERADRVIALDVGPSVIESRLRTGRIVRADDVARAQSGLYQARNLEMLRELMLRMVDQLTIPVLAPAKVSTALAVVPPMESAESFLRRSMSFANALDLALETTCFNEAERESLERIAVPLEAGVIDAPNGLARGDLGTVRATLVIVPRDALAERILSRPLDRDVLIVDPARKPMPRNLLMSSVARGVEGSGSDRMRIGYGDLTIYLGAVAGCGKTFAMLDRAHQLRDEGVDVVLGFLETHQRADTIERAQGLEELPRLPNGEMNLEAIFERRPQVVCIDELAHTNERNDDHAKRYDDVMALLSSGIDVMTTVNVQHLEGVIDAVERLTGTHVKETLPDAMLELAREVIFIDVTPDILRERLRAGKIYPADRVESALGNFFRTENLAALRELAVREILYARSNRRRERPFERIVLGVAPRTEEIDVIRRVGRIAARLKVDLRVVCSRCVDEPIDTGVRAELEQAARDAKGTFAEQLAEYPAEGFVEAAEPTDVIAVSAPHNRRRLFAGPSFARRLLRAGAAELLVLAPRMSDDSRIPPPV